MKYCEKCGKELIDEAVVCTECGCQTNTVYQPTTTVKNETSPLIGTQSLNSKNKMLSILSLGLAVLSSFIIPLLFRMIFGYSSNNTEAFFYYFLLSFVSVAGTVTGFLSTKKQINIIGLTGMIISLLNALNSIQSIMSVIIVEIF